MHLTRLFPVRIGADAYRILRIAERCDRVVLTDRRAPRTRLVKQVEDDALRHVFLSMREPNLALADLIEEWLPHLSRNFALISGAGDPHGAPADRQAMAPV